MCFGTGVVTESSQTKDIFSVCKNEELMNLKKMELKNQYQGDPRLTALTGLNVCSAKKIPRVYARYKRWRHLKKYSEMHQLTKKCELQTWWRE